MLIVTHNRFHQDEAAAIMLLAVAGEKKFPGVANATIKFVSSTHEAQAYPDALRVGVGGGPFDEHNCNSQLCAADLVAQHLGVTDDPAVTRLLDNIRRADRTANVTEYELPSLIKGWHRLHQPTVVFERARRILFDLLRFERAGQQIDRSKSTILPYLADMLQARSRISGKPLDRVLTYLTNAASSPIYRITDLANICLIWEHLYPDQRSLVSVWAMQILEDIVALNHQFQQTYASYPGTFRRVQVEGFKYPLKMAVENTENPDIPKVARAKGADIVVIRNSKGNVQIFVNHKCPLDLSAVVLFLRVEEYAAKGNKIPEYNRTHWASAENIPEVPEWYYLAAGQLILNGSNQSSTGIPPTKLSQTRIVELVTKYARRMAQQN